MLAPLLPRWSVFPHETKLISSQNTCSFWSCNPVISNHYLPSQIIYKPKNGVLMVLTWTLTGSCRLQLQRRKSGAHFSQPLDSDRITNHWNSSLSRGSVLLRPHDRCLPTPTSIPLHGLFFDQSPSSLKLVWIFFCAKLGAAQVSYKWINHPIFPKRKGYENCYMADD